MRLFIFVTQTAVAKLVRPILFPFENVNYDMYIVAENVSGQTLAEIISIEVLVSCENKLRTFRRLSFVSAMFLFVYRIYCTLGNVSDRIFMLSRAIHVEVAVICRQEKNMTRRRKLM